MSLRILVVDDHPIFRRGLIEVLHGAGHVVVAEAGDGTSALPLPQQHTPDVAIVDVGLPDIDGISVVRSWRAAGATCPVVFLSLHNEAHIVREAFEAGANAYVLKDRAADDVLAAVDAVCAGGRFVSAPVASALEARDELERLTPAELRVVALLADNLTSGEIAERLGLSLRTVQNHRAHAATRLGLSGPNRLLQFALERQARLQALVSDDERSPARS